MAPSSTNIFHEIFLLLWNNFLKMPTILYGKSLKMLKIKNQFGHYTKDVRGAQCESASKMILAWDRIKTTRSDLKKSNTLVIEQLALS